MRKVGTQQLNLDGLIPPARWADLGPALCIAKFGCAVGTDLGHKGDLGSSDWAVPKHVLCFQDLQR